MVLAVGVENVVFMSERTGAGVGGSAGGNFGLTVRIDMIVVVVAAAATTISTIIATSCACADWMRR